MSDQIAAVSCSSSWHSSSTASSRLLLGVPIVRFLLSPVARGQRPIPVVAVARTARAVSRPGETRLATYRNPVATASDGETARRRVLGATHRRRSLPGLRRQLRASRLPGAVVSAIGPVHVSVSRRRVLRRRRARVGPAGARTVRVSVQVDRGELLIRAGEMPTPGRSAAVARASDRHAPDRERAGSWFDSACN